MIILFPAALNFFVNAKPIQTLPPEMNIVFPVIFILLFKMYFLVYFFNFIN